MKVLKKGISQKIFLDQEGLSDSLTVKLSVIGEDGKFLTDSNNADVKDVALAFDATANKYFIEITLHDNSLEQYIRLLFDGDGVDNNYYPENAKLVPNIQTTFAVEVVPVQYFIDYILSVKTKLDPEYQEAVEALIEDKESIRTAILAAQNDLELELEMYITEREVTEKRDNYFEKFNMHLWQLQVTYPPINELVGVKIMYGENEIVGIGKELSTYDRLMGLVEFLPIPMGESAGLYTLMLQSASGLGFAMLRAGSLERIPNMFHITYKSGLLHSEIDRVEKESIRRAVARRAFIDIKKYFDPKSEKSSDSESIDGASSSVSIKTMELLDKLKEDEASWVKSMQLRYGKGLNMVVV